MRSTPRHLLLLACLLVLASALALTTPGVAQAQDGADEGAALTQLASRVESLRAQRARLEREHAALLDRIEGLKRARGQVDPVDDYELRRLLADARAMADRLNELSARIRQAVDEEQATRQALVAALDARIRALETELFSVPPDAQPALLAQLDVLQARRAALRSDLQARDLELAALPDLASLDSDDPDDLLAAVGELRDHEEKIQGQLASIEDRIRELDRRRRVFDFTQDTADEQSLFSEEQLSVRVASRQPSQEGQGAATNGTGNGNGNDRGGAGDDLTAGDGGADGSGDDGSGDLAEGPPATDEDSAMAPNTDGRETDEGSFTGDFGASPDPAQGASDPAPTPVTVDDPTITILPGGGGQVMIDGVIRSEADPGVVIRAGGDAEAEGSTLERELRTLRDQRRHLRGSLDDLRRQEEALRQRAFELGADLD